MVARGAGKGAAVATSVHAGDLVGYARVSTRDQTVALQPDALREAKCSRVFEETSSGAQRDRPQLAAALDYMRPGDTLVVWKLDRLARSTKQLIETLEELARRGIGFRCLTQDIGRPVVSALTSGNQSVRFPACRPGLADTLEAPAWPSFGGQQSG